MRTLTSFLQPKTPQGRIPLKESSIADTVSYALDREIPCMGTSCLKAASLKGMAFFNSFMDIRGIHKGCPHLWRGRGLATMRAKVDKEKEFSCKWTSFSVCSRGREGG